MRTETRRTFALALASIAWMACSKAATSSAPAPTPAPPITAGVVAEGIVTTRATVEKIDHKTRQVTLKREDGSRTSFRVDNRVKNLSQVVKGDVVVAEYYESLAYRLLPPGEGEPGVQVASGVGTAQPGTKPGLAGVSEINVTAKIIAVDRKKMTVTLEGPDGEPDEVKVRDPKRLEPVKVGDLVQLTYTEAVAISVEEPAPGK